MKRFLSISCLLLAAACGRRPDAASIIDTYVAEFNAADEECYSNSYPNSEAAAFLKSYVPVFECPDKELERTWWFRWWTFRKHVKEVPDGYVITEFLPEVGWAGKYNAICCAGPHHFREGRWLRDTIFMQSYMRYWFSDGANPRGYSFPVANALLDYNAVHPCPQLIESLYPELKANYAEWERTHRDANGLFWQGDGYDGMEVSISGALDPQTQGYRATINSYMIADARALAEMAGMLDLSDDAALYSAKADTLAALMDSLLWDRQAEFYKVLPRNGGDGTLSPARELHGYVPWIYGIPDASKAKAWLQLVDTLGFKAPFGPTTAERRAEGFAIAYEGHECQWNGPSWPFATAQTLTGLANCLHRDGETVLTKEHYFELLQTYSKSHRMHLDDGSEVCWIDENLNPFTGEWLARKIMLDNGFPIHERGKDYNHSTFCDLIISGLIGLEPRGDQGFSVEPLIPEGIWDWFYLGDITIAGSDIEIVWDKDGRHYGLGRGFSIFRDGRRIYHSDTYSTRFNMPRQ